MKLWIDDERPAPEGWLWVKTSFDAIEALLHNDIEEISFDHDLGGHDTTMRVVEFIEERAYFKKMTRIKWNVHSANPAGRKNLEAALNSADRIWTRRESNN
jgi:hypothetical protein